MARAALARSGAADAVASLIQRRRKPATVKRPECRVIAAPAQPLRAAGPGLGLRDNARWLGAGLLLTFGSSFGQTYFISLSGAEIRAAYDLSHGEFGLLYTLATAASAATLIQLGRVVDHLPLAPLSLATAAVLGLACLAMAGAQSIVFLVGILYLLRLSGQGMMTHIAMTAMGRWYEARRGQAVAIASLGHPFGEAVWPAVFVALAALIGWRQTWGAAGLAMIAVAGPVLYLMLSKERQPRSVGADEGQGDGAAPRRQWTRGEVLRDGLIYGLLPGTLTPAFVSTGVFFHQVHLAETKGWSLAVISACYPLFAAASVAAGILAGFAIDRWTAARVLPVMLVPMVLGLAVFAATDHVAAAFIGWGCLGLTAGCTATLMGALWAELYGVRHLGAIRALIVAFMVFATALAPGVMGLLLDGGVGLDWQFLVMAVYCVAATLPFLVLQHRMRGAGQ